MTYLVVRFFEEAVHVKTTTTDEEVRQTFLVNGKAITMVTRLPEGP